MTTMEHWLELLEVVWMAGALSRTRPANITVQLSLHLALAQAGDSMRMALVSTGNRRSKCSAKRRSRGGKATENDRYAGNEERLPALLPLTLYKRKVVDWATTSPADLVHHNKSMVVARTSAWDEARGRRRRDDFEVFRPLGVIRRKLLASVAASRISVPETRPASLDTVRPEPIAPAPARKLSLSRRVGGWVRGRWGTAPVSTNGDLEPHAEEETTSCASSMHSGSSNPSVGARNQSLKAESVPSLRFRYPGVNQKGPIMGFRPSPRAPSAIHAEQVDENLLRETLAE